MTPLDPPPPLLPLSVVSSSAGRSRGTLILLAIACLGTVLWVQIPRLGQLSRSSDQLSQVQLQRDLEREKQQLALLKQLPDLGFRNLWADWTLLKFFQYFGDDEARQRTNYSLSPDYFDVILDRDPYFRDGYFFLSGSTSMFAGRPDRTIEIINRHLPRLSPTTPEKAFYIWRYKAIDELLFLGDIAAARQSFLKAAAWAQAYPGEEGQAVAASSLQTVKFLETNPDSSAAQISAWTMVLSSARDPATREIAIRQIEKLGGVLETDAQGNVKIKMAAPPLPK